MTMASVHGIMLENVAPKIADQFRTDPKVATLIEPAVWINAIEEGCAAVIIERLEAIEAMSKCEPAEGPGVATPPPPGHPILAVVVDRRAVGTEARTFYVADPRLHPDEWPWTGSADDDEE
jgi:hypothetical protein